MNKIIIAVIAVVIVVGGAFAFKGDKTPEYINTNTSPTQNNVEIATTTTDSATKGIATTTFKTYKMSDVATHKDPNNCWTVIGNEVFDLTTWIKQHPGGDKAILSTCGIDATKAFEGQHGGKVKIEMKLDTFKIGNLIK